MGVRRRESWLMVFDKDCIQCAKVHGNQDVPCAPAYPKGTHTLTALIHLLSLHMPSAQ